MVTCMIFCGKFTIATTTRSCSSEEISLLLKQKRKQNKEITTRKKKKRMKFHYSKSDTFTEVIGDIGVHFLLNIEDNMFAEC